MALERSTNRVRSAEGRWMPDFSKSRMKGTATALAAKSSGDLANVEAGKTVCRDLRDCRGQAVSYPFLPVELKKRTSYRPT